MQYKYKDRSLIDSALKVRTNSNKKQKYTQADYDLAMAFLDREVTHKQCKAVWKCGSGAVSSKVCTAIRSFNN